MRKQTILIVAALLITIPSFTFASPFKSTLENLKSEQDETYKDIKKLDCKKEELNEMQQILEADIKEITQRIEQKEEFIKKRLVTLQVEGQVNYLDLLLGANSLNDFFHRAYSVSIILDADKKMINTFKNDVNTLTELESLLAEGVCIKNVKP